MVEEAKTKLRNQFLNAKSVAGYNLFNIIVMEANTVLEIQDIKTIIVY